MSGFEILILVIACAVPLVALIFIKPKKKKKEKKAPEVKTLQEVKTEEKVAEPKKEEPGYKKDNNIESLDEDIQSYVEYKKKNITKPQKVEMPPNFKDMSMPYIPRRRGVDKKPKTVAEEINNLSPELKAMLLAGVLDKKNYDD